MKIEVTINTSVLGNQPSYFLEILTQLLQDGRFPNGNGELLYKQMNGGDTYFTIKTED